MAVQVWIGEKPEHPNERRAMMALANGLDRLDGLYLLLANFSVGGRTVDMVIVKHDAIFIVELKHCDGRVLGSVNGPWFVEGRNGERKRINPGRKNPYNQVISYFHALTNFLNEHRHTFLSTQKANNIDFRTCKRVVVIAPSIEAGSEIELDWKVEVKGLDDLPAYLITERSSEIELSEEEMLAIPQLLHCTPWDEINTVLRGVFSEVAPTPASVSPTITPAPAPADTPLAPPWQYLRAILHTPTGWIIAGLSVVVIILFAALLLRPPQAVVLRPDQLLVPIAEVTGVPTGSVSFTAAAAASSCNWPSYQMVGKRWDAASNSWVSVATRGGSSSPDPDIVVMLEQVTTCSDQITLLWSVQNHSDETISFPLRNDNIEVSDNLGNTYMLADDASQPRMLQIAANDTVQGMAITDRPVSQSASSLRILLKNQPFGEASFIVSLQR